MKKSIWILFAAANLAAPLTQAQMQPIVDYQITVTNRQKYGFTPTEPFSEFGGFQLDDFTIRGGTNTLGPVLPYFKQKDLWMNWICTWDPNASYGGRVGTNAYHRTTIRTAENNYGICVSAIGAYVINFTSMDPTNDFGGTNDCNGWTIQHLNGSAYEYATDGRVNGTDQVYIPTAGGNAWDFWGTHDNQHGYTQHPDYSWWDPPIVFTNSLTNMFFSAAETQASGSSMTNTRFLHLSDEFMTKDLLAPFAPADQAYYSGDPRAWFGISEDQSNATNSGLRMTFSLKGPQSNFEVPYLLHLHLDEGEIGDLSFPAKDLYVTNTFYCIGLGGTNCYPVGKSLLVHPPYRKVVTNNYAYYFGGQADITLLDFYRLPDCDDKGCPVQCAACAGDESSFNPQEAGMPSWWITEPYINLWAGDTPVQYTTTLGQKIGFSTYYKQRDTRPTKVNGQDAYVPVTGWNHNWYSYIHFVGDTTFDETSGTFTNLSFANWTATVYTSGGGETSFASYQPTDPASHDKLLPLDGVNAHIYPQGTNILDGGPNVYGGAGFRLVHPDGSQDIYGAVTPLYPTTYTNKMTILQDGTDLQPPQVTWAQGQPSQLGPGASYEPFAPVEVAAFTNGVGIATSVHTNWAGLVSDSVTNLADVQIQSPVCADAVWTEHIDPYGHSIHLYYGATTNTFQVTPPVRLQSLVDYDTNTTAMSYDSYGYLSQVLMPYSRSATFQYAADTTNAQLLQVTAAAGMSSSFQYNTGADKYLNTINTPYGSTSFGYIGTNSTSLSGDGVARAILVSNPDGSQELYAFYNTASNSAPQIFNANQLPLDPTGYGLDSGSSDPFGAMFARNSFYWGRAQFSRLSNKTFSKASLNQLTAADFLLARMNHWMLQPDGVDIAPAASMSQDSSPDGTTAGLRTWYIYPDDIYGRGYGDCPWRLNDDVGGGPAYKVRLQPDGSTWYEQTIPYDLGLPGSIVTHFTLPDGSQDSRTRSFGYDYLAYRADCSTSQTNVGSYSWIGYRLSGFSDPDTSWTTSWPGGGYYVPTDFFTNSETRAGYTFTTVYPNYPSMAFSDGYGTSTEYYNGRGQVIGARTAAGLAITNIYGANGFLSKSIALDIQATNYYTFFAYGLLANRTDPLGLTTSYTWDMLNRLTQIGFPDGTSIKNAYTNLDLAGQKDRLGRWTHMTYDANRRLTSSTDRNGNTTTLSYCDCGALESITDPLGKSTLFYRDLASRVTNIVYGSQGNRSFALDVLGEPITITDTMPGGVRTVNCTFDNAGRLIKAMTGQDLIYGANYGYNGYNVPAWVTNADGLVVHNYYGNNDRLTGRDYANGMWQSWDYSSLPGGLLASTSQSGGHSAWYTYDPAGQVLSAQQTGGNPVQFGYGRGGELLRMTNENNAVTSWRYDIYGRMLAKTNANGLCVETNGYDANSRLIAHWTPAKGLTRYNYDNNGNLLHVYYPDSTVSYGYDALNRIVGMGDQVGGSTFTYQAFGAFSGALASETGPLGDRVSRTYQNRQLRSMSVGSWSQTYTSDTLGRLQNITSPAGSFTYNYAGAGSLIQSLSLPGGSSIGYTYDPVGLLASTTLKNSGDAELDSYAYTYDLGGLRTSVLRNNSINVAYGYDALGQLTSATGSEPGGNTRHNENFSYTYDPAGNLLSRINDSLQQAFTVDPANQLTNISRNDLLTVAGGLTNTPGDLKINGVSANRYSDQTFAAPAVSLLNGTNRFTNVLTLGALLLTNVLTQALPTNITPAYDLNGNMVSDGRHGYEYDSANQLVGITETNSSRSVFAYDGLGRRRIRREYSWVANSWQQTSEVRYVYDGMLVIQERDQNGTPRVTYTRGADLSGGLQGAGGIGGLLARTDGSGSAYYHADGGGNITVMVNGQGTLVAKYLYDAYGNLLGKWGSLADANLMRFSSKEVHVPSGLYYYGFRFYDPNLQRWPNHDPIREAGGINLYGFVGNDPTSSADPFGLAFRQMAAGGFLTPGPASYYQGDTLLENLGATVYNSLALVNNVVSQPLRGLGIVGTFVDETVKEGVRVTGGNEMDADNAVLGANIGLFFFGGEGAEAGKVCAAKAAPQVEQYALKALEDGFYPVMKRGFKEPQAGIWLDAGDVWKYGTTKNPATRYSQTFLDDWGLFYEKQASGTLQQALSAEKGNIVNFLNQTGKLPSGNKIIR